MAGKGNVAVFSKKRRWAEIDIFRGLAISCMLIVNALPDFSEAYPLLLHSSWEGITLADLAFPGFVFAMGLSAALWFPKHGRESALKKAAVILRRGMILFLLGYVLNQVPLLLQHVFYPEAGASLWEEMASHGRILGVLQRLGLVYACGMFAAWRLEGDVSLGSFALLLLAVSSLGFHLYSPAAPFSQEGNISMAVDAVFPGKEHCYMQGDSDPEGLYGTLAAASSFLWGLLAGRWLTRGGAGVLALAGVALLLAGGLWSCQDIVCKALWTAPYVLLTSGGFMLLLFLLQLLLGWGPDLAVLFAPCRIMGSNPLLLYIFTEISLMLLWTIKTSSGQLLYAWLWENSLKGVVSVPFSIFLFAFLWLALWLLAAGYLARKHIFLRV